MSVSESRACAVVDAGMKAVSLDSGPPVLLEQPNVAAGLVPSASGSSSSSLFCEGVEFQNGGEHVNVSAVTPG